MHLLAANRGTWELLAGAVTSEGLCAETIRPWSLWVGSLQGESENFYCQGRALLFGYKRTQGVSQKHPRTTFGAVVSEGLRAAIAQLCPAASSCGGGRLRFCCWGFVPLVGFACAQWWLPEAPGVICQCGVLRGALGMKLSDQGVLWAGSLERRIPNFYCQGCAPLFG